MESWNYTNPPIWESAIAVTTEAPTLYDPYDIAEVHKLFAPSYPRAERQVPLVNIEPFPIGTPLQLAHVKLSPMPQFNRWTFSSEDARNLIQVQENLAGTNWRRTDPSPATDQSHKTFDELLREFQALKQKLEIYHNSRKTELPSPNLMNLVYINHLSMDAKDRSRMKIREALPFLNFIDDRLKGNVNAHWIEEIVNAEGIKSSGNMMVSANIISIPIFNTAGELEELPFARLAFDARATCSSWEEAYSLAHASHAYMRERLLALTTAEMRATWK